MKSIKLTKFKKGTTGKGYRIEDLARMFEVSDRTIVNWLKADCDYKRENGNHIISRNQVIKTIPIKKEK